MTLEGEVLELFGFVDAARLHIAYRSDLQFEDGRRPRLRITDVNGTRHAFDHDPLRRAALETFAEHLRAAHRP